MDSKIETISNEIRQKLLDLYANTQECYQTGIFPEIPSKLTNSIELLKDDSFDLVVCGEVKKGKSSLINAIIGELILPVDTKVATAQAFRIINSEDTGYYLIYTSGEKKEISKEELYTFGSQSTIDTEGEHIINSDIVDYIEVKTPISFLPKEIVIVDTPGIGALYANHAAITERHLKKAMAAIFVMDPQNPLTRPELDFLKKVVDITPNVTLVMTKADNYDKAYIDAQCRRNEEILIENGFNDIIGYNNGKIDILPVSSMILSCAANNTENRELLYEASQFDIVKSKIIELSHITIALSKNILAYNSLNEYNSSVVQILKDNDEILKSPNSARNLLEEKTKRQSEFQSKWGPHGTEQAKIITKINTIIQSFNNQAMALFNPGSVTYNKFLNEIDSLEHLDEAKDYSSSFSKRMVTEYGQMWRCLCEQCSGAIDSELVKFGEALSQDTKPESGDISDGMTLRVCDVPKFKFMDHFNNCRNGYLTYSIIGGLGATLFTSLAPVIAIAAVIMGGLSIFHGKNKPRLEKMRVDLKNILNMNLNSLRENVLIKPIENDFGPSRLEKVKQEFIENGKQAIAKIYKEQQNIYNKEISDITEKIQLAKIQRENLTNQSATIREKWTPINQVLSDTGENLKDLETVINESIYLN